MLLVFLSLLTCITLVSPTQAYSQVGGSISQDTTWTKAGSPYDFTGIVNIEAGVTLTIEPGVTVNLGDWSLLVSGTLNARGTDADKFIFHKGYNGSYSYAALIMVGTRSPGWDEITGQGCIIENAVLDSVMLHISSSMKLSKIESNTKIQIMYGSPLITDCSFNIKEGINIYNAQPTFTNNIIIGHGEGSAISGSGNITFLGNTISYFVTGISVYSGNWLISNNTISRCNNGIELDAIANVTIQKNSIYNNNLNGISGGNAVIDSNSIVHNQIGIYNPLAGTTIHGNNIVGNSVNSITTAVDIDASLNYWGTTDFDAVNQTIYDYYDDQQWGKVTFTPILNAANPDAPTIPGYFDPVEVTVPPQGAPGNPGAVSATSTPMPTVDHNAVKNNANQDTSLLNLNTLVLVVAVPLAVVWVVVLLSYRVKGKIRELKES
jgi:hypothetical protein